nr:hypothetical protein pmam_294 [Pithovirus mammoth]
MQFGWKFCLKLQVRKLQFGWKFCLKLQVRKLQFGWKFCLKLQVRKLQFGWKFSDEPVQKKETLDGVPEEKTISKHIEF